MLTILTFLNVKDIITSTYFEVLDPFLSSFDDFVDDLLSSDFDLLKGELDFLIIQHIFQSIDLEIMNDSEFQNDESLAA